VSIRSSLPTPTEATRRLRWLRTASGQEDAIRSGHQRGPSTRLGRQLTGRGLDRFVGAIAAGGFASGDQVVVGLWHASPIGPFADVMWVRPDGERVLLAPRREVRGLVTSLYAFDEARVVPVSGGWDGTGIDLAAGPLHLRLVPAARGWDSWVFAARPGPLRRSPAWIALEDRLVGPLGGMLLDGAEGVALTGVTPGGAREWYSITDRRPLRSGTLVVGRAHAGDLRPLRPGLGVGLSDFPSQPALVHVTTLIEPVARAPR
jgi:hypothetical protein